MNEELLERVRKLLAKAEGTSFEVEAEAFFAKAQELMQAHAITEAMLARERGSSEKPILLSVRAEAPYSREKLTLLSAVARQNRCRVVELGYEGEPGRRGDLFGFPSDVEYVQTLWTSLMVHAVSEMMKLRASSSARRGATETLRRSFWLGYARRIIERLREANRTAEHESGHSGSSMALALRDREEEVGAAVAEHYPRLRTLTRNVSSLAGYRAGHAAGGRADLGGAKLGGHLGALER